MTKTEAVSKLLDQEPTITAKDAVAALKKKGVEINEQGFYNYKNLWKKSKAESGATGNSVEASAAPKKSSAAKAGEGTRILATLQKLEELAAEVGGYNELKRLIDFLEK